MIGGAAEMLDDQDRIRATTRQRIKKAKRKIRSKSVDVLAIAEIRHHDLNLK